MFLDHFGPSALFWVVILIIVFITTFTGYLDRRNRYRVIEKMIDTGKTVPPEMLSRHQLPYDRHGWRYQHPASSGIFLMCMGVAIAIFFWAMQGGGELINDGEMNYWRS